MKKLNKNGFTLIELLAVITIMGILILVAIPTISRTIENSRKDTFIDTAKQYVSGAKNMWIADDLVCSVDGSTYAPSAVPAGAYYIPVDTASSDNLPVLLEQGGKSSWGKRDVKGYVLVYIDEDDEGQRKISYYPVLVDGVHGVNVSNALTLSDKLVRGDLQMSGASYDELNTSNVQHIIDENTIKASICSTAAHIASGAGGSTAEWEIVSGDINTLGSEVAIGDEHFYVIGYNGDNAILFAQYNLRVGGFFSYISTPGPIPNPTGKQDIEARAGNGGSWDDYYGVVGYSNTSTAYSGSIVEGYVNDYVTYLKGQGVSVVSSRLITKDELIGLGCTIDGDHGFCDFAPEWIGFSSYWTETAANTEQLWAVDFEMSSMRLYSYSDDDYFGVRPVIEVPISEF